MPPNLGGFFMVRSYYPSECHADYFDFERIEALKPAIEAGGISTLSQSPILGFHKQMDNRIKRVEEILSFFFFSSRRRHTRCSRDWSSDVCSSDLSPGHLHRHHRHDSPGGGGPGCLGARTNALPEGRNAGRRQAVVPAASRVDHHAPLRDRKSVV